MLLQSPCHSIQKNQNFNEDNTEKWTRLYDYIDLEYNNIMTHTKENYPQLNDKDLLLIALSVLDFSCVQIAIIMGYNNASSIGVIRQRLAKKMLLKSSLKDYIGEFSNH